MKKAKFEDILKVMAVIVLYDVRKEFLISQELLHVINILKYL